MYIGFVAWEHAPGSGVPRLLERLRHEQPRYTPPLVSATSALSAVFFPGQAQRLLGNSAGSDLARNFVRGYGTIYRTSFTENGVFSVENLDRTTLPARAGVRFRPLFRQLKSVRVQPQDYQMNITLRISLASTAHGL